MNEESQILFMQIRLIRMMAEKNNLTLKQSAELFDKYNVLLFTREVLGIFHVEGDEAVCEDVIQFLKAKGAVL